MPKRVPRRLSFSIAGLAFVVAACSARPGVLAEGPTGCYSFDRPISYSAPGTRESGDSAWYVLQLLPEGRVDRPLMPTITRDRYAQRSTWRVAGDTLHIRVFDGLVGWDLALMRDDGRYRGIGTYLSDVIVIGREPTTDAFSGGRVDCARMAPPHCCLHA